MVIFAETKTNMKPIFFVPVLFFVLMMNAQEEKIVSDSLYNGSLTIEADEQVAKLIKNQIRANCDFGDVKDKDLCEVYPKIIGYKIQVFVSNNRKEAEENLNIAKAKFASLLPVMTYKSPNFRVLLGSYISQESSQGDLEKVRRQFKNAVLIKQPILCANAK